MESAGIYKVVEYYNVPVITIRSISNLLDELGNDLGTKPDALQICSERLAICLMQLLSHINNLELSPCHHESSEESPTAAQFLA